MSQMRVLNRSTTPRAAFQKGSTARSGVSVTSADAFVPCIPCGVCLRQSLATQATANGSAGPSTVQAPPSTEFERAVQNLALGKPVAILDATDREGETDIFFPALSFKPSDLRFLRRNAGGELYIAVGHNVAEHFDLPYVADVFASAADQHPVLGGMAKFMGDMCQGKCSVGLSLDHRSTHTGAPDDERSFTVRRLAELYVETAENEVAHAASALGREYHVPGHIFLCIENAGGVAARQGHSDLSIALARAAGVVPVMVGCVMLQNDGPDFGAVSPDAAQEWCRQNDVPFVTGKDILDAVL